MKPETGLLLRMVGPLIEVICVALLLRYRGQGLQVLGLPLDQILVAGLFLGLALVIAGLTLVRRPPPTRRPPRL